MDLVAPSLRQLLINRSSFLIPRSFEKLKVFYVHHRQWRHDARGAEAGLSRGAKSGVSSILREQNVALGVGKKTLSIWSGSKTARSLSFRAAGGCSPGPPYPSIRRLRPFKSPKELTRGGIPRYDFWRPRRTTNLDEVRHSLGSIAENWCALNCRLPRKRDDQ